MCVSLSAPGTLRAGCKGIGDDRRQRRGGMYISGNDVVHNADSRIHFLEDYAEIFNLPDRTWPRRGPEHRDYCLRL